MFKTITSSRIKSETFCTEDIKAWDFVQIPCDDRCYHVFYITKDQVSDIDKNYLGNQGILLTASLDEVFELVDKNKIVIEEIQVMVQPTSNLSERWSMLFIKQIYRGFIEDLYKTADWLLFIEYVRILVVAFMIARHLGIEIKNCKMRSAYLNIT